MNSIKIFPNIYMDFIEKSLSSFAVITYMYDSYDPDRTEHLQTASIIINYIFLKR